MTFQAKKQLLTSTGVAIAIAAAAPAYAQVAGPEAGAPAAEADAPPSEERLIALAADVEAPARAGAGGHIRPFGGGILPNAGTIRGFAGPVMGTAGTIRGFEGDMTASAGTIRGFAGTIRGFAGTIRGFEAQVNPLAGPDKAFWGTLAPQAGSLSANAGTIRGFAGDFEAMAGTIRGFAGQIRTSAGTIRGFGEASATYNGMLAGVKDLVADSKATWGAAIEKQTGRSFENAFANKMLAKYGVDLNRADSLVGLNEVGVELFLLDWYDNLNNYSGQDQVDHWMEQTGWSPALTQGLDRTQRTRIGVLDFAIAGDDFDHLQTQSGIKDVDGSHGSAVASLIAARHDGRGVMGIAPGAKVFGYNPFDTSYTAGWTDVRNGVVNLLNNGASVVNMSLGVSGKVLDSGWTNDVFGHSTFKNNAALRAKAKNAVFVLAAGNDGVTHNKDSKVTWNFDTNPNIIIVGSVDPKNQISTFSNRPGEAQFDKKAGNDPLGTDKLRDRFIVAPGEFMLVSDGQGGVTRMSGTSFAAPLVSGTIALVHARWPWLSDNPVDTVNLILNSTDDLGARGTDNVYGRGMLNVAKALQPSNWWALQWRSFSATNSSGSKTSASSILETSQKTINSWEANKVYFYLFEDTGKLADSHRDFAVPMSSKLVGQTAGQTGEQFDAYLQQGFWGWFNANQGCDDDCGGGDDDDDDFANRYMTSRIANIAGMDTVAYAVPRAWRPGLRQSNVPFDTALALRSREHGVTLKFGNGAGGMFTGQKGFGLQSDYDVLTGGANPFMGLASGAAYGAIEMAIGPKVTVSTGVSHQNAVLDLDRMGMRERQVMGSLDPYRASANNLTVTYRANDRFSANIGYTMLNEDTALLGVRSLDPNDLANGSTTDATTMGASYATPSGLSLAVTGTLGRTRPGDTGDQGIAVASGGLVSSAWQVALEKDGFFDRDDRVRLTFAQPLHLERGRIDMTMAAVIDRETGEIGELVQSTALEAGRRSFVAEAAYGRSFADGLGQVNLFGRANLRSDDTKQASLMLGGNVRIGW